MKKKMNEKFSMIEKKDLEIISKIWKASLPNDFFSILGHSFITKVYFEIFFNLDKKLSLKLTQGDKIIGFVLYGRFDKLVEKILKENFFILLYRLITSILINYKALFIIINVVTFTFLIRDFKYLNTNKTELLTIAVHPNLHGKGFGTKLLNKSISIIENMKFSDEIYVKTKLKTPKFYQNCDFKIVKKIFGRCFLIRKIKI